MSQEQHVEKLIRHLESIHDLSARDRETLRALPLKISALPARHDIVREGDRPTRCCILFDGMICWNKTTGEGSRQILSFHVSGDLPDLHSLHFGAMDSSLQTISPSTVGFVAHDVVRALTKDHPTIASALWRSTLIDAAIFREWVANVGGRKAYGRVAHLLCELFVRLAAVGRVRDGRRCELPLTQNDIADATGLSVVHANRSLQALRRDNLVRIDKAELEVLDWPRLKEAGDFDVSYLHLNAAAIPPTPVQI